MQVRSAFVVVANVFALVRLLPGRDRDKDVEPGVAAARSQAHALLAADFIETATLPLTRDADRDPVRAGVIEHVSRRVRVLGVTAHPNAAWVTQAARHLVVDLDETGPHGPRLSVFWAAIAASRVAASAQLPWNPNGTRDTARYAATAFRLAENGAVMLTTFGEENHVTRSGNGPCRGEVSHQCAPVVPFVPIGGLLTAVR